MIKTDIFAITVSGLSAAHTIYLAGGNVAVLDKQGVFSSISYPYIRGPIPSWRAEAYIKHVIIQVSLVETQLRPHPVSTALSPGHRLILASKTALSNFTMIPSSQLVIRLARTSSRCSLTSRPLLLSGCRMFSTSTLPSSPVSAATHSLVLIVAMMRSSPAWLLHTP